MLQRPQSCLMQHTGALRATAAVRNDRLHLPVTLVVSYKQPRPGLPVPGLHRMTMTMRRGACVGLYTLYTAEWTIPGGISFASKIDIVSGEVGRRGTAVADEFIDAVDLSGKCSPFRGPPAHLCSSLGVGSSTAAAGGVAEQTRTQTTTGLVAAVPTTMFTTTTTATTPATAAGGMYLSSSSPTAVPPQGEPDASLQSPDATTNGHALHLGETFISFFQYLTNYVVNYFFSYDRWQLVNNQLDRVT
ncbi:hypothetical protein VTK73DRAFT_9023 [Phialemonium thermophilum]|uniref:Uncharacterized protein n=1 Tax=Phialemonium thermophilum TaxID=223376 RepID=A0ABR3W518_9PEZI